MRSAYLITAYDNPRHLAALLARVCPPGSPDLAFVHLDAKSPLLAEAAGFAAISPNIRLVADPARVFWGDASMLQAIRKLLRDAVREDWTHAHLISGTDWPLVSRERMAAEVGDACWIEANPGIQAERMEIYRLDSRWLRPDETRPLQYYMSRGLRRLSFALPRRRNHLFGPWHKGLSWWTLPHEVCRCVHAEIERGYAANIFAGAIVTDEHVVQTIVAHHFPDRIAGHRHFLRWPAGASSPDWLTAADWPAAKASGAWFARKCAVDRDPFFLKD